MRRVCFILAACLLLATGCSSDGPRELPFPTFDAKAPFPGLSSPKSSMAGKAGGGTGKSKFEKAIAESMEEGEEADEAEKSAETIKRQDVPLAGSLVSSIPLEFDEWQWSTKGRVTIITHRKPGASQPDALVYVEQFSPLIRTLPSVEVRRFQQTVDPALVSSFSLPGLSHALIGKLSKQTGVDVAQLTDALTRAASHTMGLGLNYRSGEDTFTGWQWVGHNDHDVALRLGRTAGNWRTRPDADAAVGPVFAQISRKVSALSGVRSRYSEVLSNQAGRQDAGWPAWMILGSAVVERDRGLHIAILCKTTPNCAVAGELSELVANIRPVDSSTVEALREQGAKTSLPDFAKQQGLPFVDGDKLLNPGEMGEELQRALGE